MELIGTLRCEAPDWYTALWIRLYRKRWRRVWRRYEPSEESTEYMSRIAFCPNECRVDVTLAGPYPVQIYHVPTGQGHQDAYRAARLMIETHLRIYRAEREWYDV